MAVAATRSCCVRRPRQLLLHAASRRHGWKTSGHRPSPELWTHVAVAPALFTSRLALT